MKYKLLTIGADPEVFIKDESGNIISAENLIGGDKDKPLKITGFNGLSFGLLEDNVMAEYNIPPCKNVVDFIKYNNFMIETINTVLPDGLSVKISSQENFEWEKLLSEKAMEFGCMPSIDAWSLDEFILNLNPMESNERCAGGHIHIGYNNPSPDRNIHLIRALDNVLGVFSREIDDTSRNLNYGKLGNFRAKPYGVEYRTPSNWWLRSDLNMNILFYLIEKSFAYANDKEEINTVEFSGGMIYDDVISHFKIKELTI